MSRVFSLILLSLLLSCTNNDVHRESLNKLSQDWSDTQASLSDLETAFNATIKSANARISKKSLADNEVKEHSEDLYNKWIDTKINLMSIMEKMSFIQAEFAPLKKKWSSRSLDLRALKNELEAGTPDGDVKSQIEDLRGFQRSSQIKIDQLSEDLESFKPELESGVSRWYTTHDSIRQVMAE